MPKKGYCGVKVFTKDLLYINHKGSICLLSQSLGKHFLASLTISAGGSSVQLSDVWNVMGWVHVRYSSSSSSLKLQA